MEWASRPAGLRAWKKERTRTTISDVATGLFMRDGFEQVTVAQIAAAAEVSVKTVFNYFPSKEDLFFDRADDVIGALVDAVVERPAGHDDRRRAAPRCWPTGACRSTRRAGAALRDPEGYERLPALPRDRGELPRAADAAAGDRASCGRRG